jgi:hypothetical protein
MNSKAVTITMIWITRKANKKMATLFDSTVLAIKNITSWNKMIPPTLKMISARLVVGFESKSSGYT